MYDTHKNYKDVDKFSKYFVDYKTYHVLKKYENNKNFFNYTILPPYESTKQNIGTMRWGGESFFPYEPYNDENYIGAYAVTEKEYIRQNIRLLKPDSIFFPCKSEKHSR